MGFLENQKFKICSDRSKLYKKKKFYEIKIMPMINFNGIRKKTQKIRDQFGVKDNTNKKFAIFYKVDQLNGRLCENISNRIILFSYRHNYRPFGSKIYPQF